MPWSVTGSAVAISISPWLTSERGVADYFRFLSTSQPLSVAGPYNETAEYVIMTKWGEAVRCLTTQAQCAVPHRRGASRRRGGIRRSCLVDSGRRQRSLRRSLESVGVHLGPTACLPRWGRRGAHSVRPARSPPQDLPTPGRIPRMRPGLHSGYTSGWVVLSAKPIAAATRTPRDDSHGCSTIGNIPAIPAVYPNGMRCCGCDETPKRGTFLAVTHDRRAEARAIRERFGDIAWQLLPWWRQTRGPAEPTLPSSATARPGGFSIRRSWQTDSLPTLSEDRCTDAGRLQQWNCCPSSGSTNTTFGSVPRRAPRDLQRFSRLMHLSRGMPILGGASSRGSERLGGSRWCFTSYW